MTTEQSLAGKHALIMGVRADVAEAIALALAAAGADVALTTATHDAEEAFSLRRITRGVKGLGRASMNESVDMSIGTGVQIAMRQVAKELGGLDIILAGPDLQVEKPSERLTDADWSKLINTNLSATYFACRSAFRELQSNEPPGGHIIAILPPPEASATQPAVYEAVRTGVAALIDGLTREWAADGIMVSQIEMPAEDRGIAAVAAEVLKSVTTAPLR